MDNPNIEQMSNAENQVTPLVEPIVEKETDVFPMVEEETDISPIAEKLETEEVEIGSGAENSNQQIPLTTDKATLGMLSQNLNANLLVTSSAYKALLSRLKENMSNEEKQNALEKNIEELDKLEDMLSGLLVSVQNNLEIDPENIINPSVILEEVKGSGKFMQTLLNTEAIAILAAMLAPIGLGGGSNRKKKTKRRKNKGKKQTKRASKI